MAKFKVGDRIIDKKKQWLNCVSSGTVVVVENNGSYLCTLDKDHCMSYFKWRFLEDHLELYFVKVKATRLAKKMYPNAEEEGGFLLVEA